jgi:hypothetical protein
MALKIYDYVHRSHYGMHEITDRIEETSSPTYLFSGGAVMVFVRIRATETSE